MNTRTFLKQILYTKAELDDWLSGRTHKMEKYDPELGWVLNTCCAHDGLDGSINDQLVVVLDPQAPAYRFDTLSVRSHEAYDYDLVWKSSRCVDTEWWERRPRRDRLMLATESQRGRRSHVSLAAQAF